MLLHPHSYHPSKRMCANTYVSSAFRATKIGTDPSQTLDHLIRKYLPALTRLGHKPNEVIEKHTNIAYFPKHSTKKPWEYKPILKYTYSETRPTKKQMEPLTKKDYHVIPNIPLAPLKGILNYQKPGKQTEHHWHKCDTQQCSKCSKYYPIINTKKQHSHNPLLTVALRIHSTPSRRTKPRRKEPLHINGKHNKLYPQHGYNTGHHLQHPLWKRPTMANTLHLPCYAQKSIQSRRQNNNQMGKNDTKEIPKCINSQTKKPQKLLQ